MSENVLIIQDMKKEHNNPHYIGCSLAGNVPIGNLENKPTIERDPANIFWPHVWKQNNCLIAIDGYIVWPDNLMIGHSQDEMDKVGKAILKDPVNWLRELKNGCFNIVLHDHVKKRTLFLSDRFGFLRSI